MFIAFDNSYARLPPRFFSRQALAPVSGPVLMKLNLPLAAELGLDPEWLGSEEGVAVLAGNRVAEGSEPISQAYAGHQFGHFNPQLGDGRATLLGEVVGPDGVRRDIQLKGAGRTAWSRGGDGRAAVGPVLREYIISEAMFALGIPTTRSLAAVATNEPVFREAVLPGAVLTRVASSHIRVGTFQYFAARGDIEGVRLLADHVMARHYPEAGSYEAFLAAVVAAQASLVARWMLVGFIHGVMNTDNCSVAGETIDYGPCAFMDAYDPATVFSSIDRGGRYAYGNQPRIALWNLTRLAETLVPLLADDADEGVKRAEAVLSGFGAAFEAAYLGGLRAKAGLAGDVEGDDALVQDLLRLMAETEADFTGTFRALCDPGADPGPAFADWTARWRARRAAGPALSEEAMRAVNPVYIPRNHLVEAALKAAEAGELGPLDALLAVLARPFEARAGLERYAAPAGEGERVLQTFCGT